jgi:hypothetical protein
MWTDRQTDMTKLIIAFRNFANAPKNTATGLVSEKGGFIPFPLCRARSRLGFIQKPTFEKPGFQIQVFPKKPVKTGFRIFAKNVIKSKKIFTLILKYV